MKVDERNTCMCQKCSNFTFITHKLKELDVIKYRDPEELIQRELCCFENTNDCVLRVCDNCSDKEVEIKPFDGALKVEYEKWVLKGSTISNDTKESVR